MWKTVIFASRFKTQKVNIMLLHPNDNVGLALTKIKENCSFENVIVQKNIPAGHKIALAEIQKVEAIRKYNQTIGFASQTIHAGDQVHTHNIEMLSFERSHQSVVVQKIKTLQRKNPMNQQAFRVIYDQMERWEPEITLEF